MKYPDCQHLAAAGSRIVAACLSRLLSIALTALGLGAGTIPASAATPCAGDFRFWPQVAVSAPIRENWQLKGDALIETSGNGARTGLELLRLVVLRKVSDRAALGGGYTLVHGQACGGNAYVEHRAVQDVQLRLLGKPDGILLTSRVRLEERLRASRTDVAMRLRLQARLELPLARNAIRAVVWIEYFHGLNRTDWSGRPGPGLALTFVGLHVPVKKNLWIEPGYLNQRFLTASHPQVRHIGALTLGIKL